MGIEVDIYVNPRVQERHPDMSPATVQDVEYHPKIHSPRH